MDWSAPVRTGPDRTGPERSGPEQAEPGRTGLDQTGPDWFGPARNGPDPPGPVRGNVTGGGPRPGSPEARDRGSGAGPWGAGLGPLWTGYLSRIVGKLAFWSRLETHERTTHLFF